jgi:hypothetical protein
MIIKKWKFAKIVFGKYLCPSVIRFPFTASSANRYDLFFFTVCILLCIIIYQIKNRQHNTNSQFQMHSSGYISYVKNNMFRLFHSSSGFFHTHT